MPEYRRRELGDILLGHVGPGVPQGQGFAREDKGLGRSRARPPANPFLNEIRGMLVAGPCRRREADGVAHDFIGYRDLFHQRLEADDVFSGKDGFDRVVVSRGRLFDDFDFVVLGQIVDQDIEKKAV